jgi:hypothetical protein
MRAVILFVVCLVPVLTVSAAEPHVDDVFSQDDAQNIRKVIASLTADPIEAINSVNGDEHVVGVVPRQAINISRDGTESPITIYIRSDVASVLTSNKDHLLTEYKMRKGPQGWAMEIERFSWSDYPVECLWYLFLGLILHLLFFAAGCICLIVVHLYRRSGYFTLVWRWGQFNVVFLLVACAVAGFWSCLVVGRFYTSSDYISDFNPLIPITQSVIDARFGNRIGHLNGITLRQLQLLWMAFAATTWVLALCIYFLARRWGSSLREKPNQSLEPTAGRGEVHI